MNQNSDGPTRRAASDTDLYHLALDPRVMSGYMNLAHRHRADAMMSCIHEVAHLFADGARWILHRLRPGDVGHPRQPYAS